MKVIFMGEILTSFDLNALLERVGQEGILAKYRKDEVFFSQGDAADRIFYIQKGQIKLTVLSTTGKEAVLAILTAGTFFGEEACMTNQHERTATATAITGGSILRISRKAMLAELRRESTFSNAFTNCLLARIVRLEEDLVDQFFNSSEKRLARVLLTLANLELEQAPERVVIHVSQGTLAEMVGTTRPRVNFFLNKFKKLGLIEYDGGLKICSSLLTFFDHSHGSTNHR
jgi:CRP/FNR family cyclic AMP-dependent transcriptional regulator